MAVEIPWTKLGNLAGDLHLQPQGCFNFTHPPISPHLCPFLLPTLQLLDDICHLPSPAADLTWPLWPFTRQLLALWNFLRPVAHSGLPQEDGLVGPAAASLMARPGMPVSSGKKKVANVSWGSRAQDGRGLRLQGQVNSRSPTFWSGGLTTKPNWLSGSEWKENTSHIVPN